MNTLSILFNSDMSEVLVCTDKKQKIMTFIGDEIQTLESAIDASYRNVEKYTGLTQNDIALKLVEAERTTLADGTVIANYVTYGVVLDKSKVVESEYPLLWVRDWDFLRACGQDGNCAVYLNRVLRLLTEQKI